MLDFAKKCLRIRRDNTAFDDEVADLIAACKADLRKHGVVKISESDPLIKQAVKLYCKGNFGYGGDDAERFQKCCARFDSAIHCNRNRDEPQLV